MALVGVIGVAGACQAPAQAAILPALVGREDLAGAVSLNSAQMNASRVVGPLAAGLVVGVSHTALIFLINAATYLFVIAAFAFVPFASKPIGRSHESPLRRLADGVRAARADVVITRVLVTVSLFSLFSLVFIYQLHPFAIHRLGGNDNTFTVLFSSFGLGACLGAIAVGTVLARFSRPLMTRVALAGFAVSLFVLAIQRQPWAANVAAFFTGLCYFVVITALSTILQERVDDAVRGRVMGLWMMGWAGLVPLGGLDRRHPHRRHRAAHRVQFRRRSGVGPGAVRPPRHPRRHGPDRAARAVTPRRAPALSAPPAPGRPRGCP